MDGIFRIFAGMLGGFAASASKILAFDVDQINHVMQHGLSTDLAEIKVTLFVFTPILVALGGIIAWASQENNRMKALALGCAAPALIAPWTAASKLPQSASLIQPAYAQTADNQANEGDGKYTKAFKAIFGIENIDDKKYWVIVGSKEDLNEAKAYADEINSRSNDLKAFVGQKQPKNKHFPIIVGGPNAYLKLDAAKKLKAHATKLEIIQDNAYLSDFKDRLPAIQ